MYAVSLTIIPPRLLRPGPVLDSLMAQTPKPIRILLCRPKKWERFPGTYPCPDLPAGVSVLESTTDLGPATKALPTASALAKQVNRLIYCDDDWLYPPGWAGQLLQARKDRPETVAASGFAITRLKRRYHGAASIDGFTDIAQGFDEVQRQAASPGPRPIRLR